MFDLFGGLKGFDPPLLDGRMSGLPLQARVRHQLCHILLTITADWEYCVVVRDTGPLCGVWRLSWRGIQSWRRISTLITYQR
jgi:hypothetical protein